jgi:hypothetical protein
MGSRRASLCVLGTWPLYKLAHATPVSRDMEYGLAPAEDYAFTSYRLSQDLRPHDLIRRFGEPIRERRDPESLGAYVFLGPEAEVLTVYYRANDVDAEQLELVRVKFWQSREIYSFSIGAKSYAHATRFKEWLVNQLRAR